MEVSNRIVIFSRGNLEQIGTPREVYEQPANEFVARFIGVMNVLDTEVKDGAARISELEFPAHGQAGRHAPAHRFPPLCRADFHRPRPVSISRRAAPHVFPRHHAAIGTGTSVRSDPSQPDDKRGICATRFAGRPGNIISNPELPRAGGGNRRSAAGRGNDLSASSDHRRTYLIRNVLPGRCFSQNHLASLQCRAAIRIQRIHRSQHFRLVRFDVLFRRQFSQSSGKTLEVNLDGLF